MLAALPKSHPASTGMGFLITLIKIQSFEAFASKSGGQSRPDVEVQLWKVTRVTATQCALLCLRHR
jgi:hypothetical protein